MPEPAATPDPEAPPILTLLQQIRDGTVSPRTLTKELRQACVETLILEGYTVSGIAQIVVRSEKTIKRDLTEIRVRNALSPSLELARQLIGGLCMKAEVRQAHLTRLARSSEGAVGERAQAEYLAWRVAKDLTELLQSLGYLPNRTQEIVANLVSQAPGDVEEPSLEAVARTLAEIEEAGRQTSQGLTPKVAAGLQALRVRLEQARMAEEARQLLEHQRKVSEDPETYDAG